MQVIVFAALASPLAFSHRHAVSPQHSRKLSYDSAVHSETIEDSDFCIHTASCSDLHAAFLPPCLDGFTKCPEQGRHTCWQQDENTGETSMMGVQKITLTARAGYETASKAAEAAKFPESPPHPPEATIVVLLEDATGNEVPNTRKTLQLTETDASFVLTEPCSTPGSCSQKYWVVLHYDPPMGSEGTPAASGAHIFYTVRFFGSVGSSRTSDLPTPCEGPPPPPEGLSTRDLGLVVGLSLGIPLRMY